MPDFLNDIKHCLETLQAGDVILYPTDTIWGLGCDATNSSAVQKLISIKGKVANKGLIVLLTSEREVLQYVAAPDMEVFDYLAGSVHPTTVIFKNGLNVAGEVLNSDGSIAIRLVKDEFCSHLIKRFKKPVVSTSANFHGQPSPQNFKTISPIIIDAVNYVVKFRQTEDNVYNASAIIRWCDGKAEVLRG